VLGDGSVSAFHEDRTLTNALAEVMKFGTADFAFGDHFDFCDTRGVEREYALDTFAVGNFTNGERGVDAGSAFGDNDACEDLDALFSAFDNAAMHFDRVAYIEFCNVLVELLLFDFLDDIHDLVRKG
jgi:hypothetical protein